MRNVTISLPEKIACWARVRAAEQDTSLSRMLGEMLKEQMESEKAYSMAMKSFLSKKGRKLKKTGKYPSRELIHER